MAEWVMRYLQRLERQAGMDGRRRRRAIAVGHLQQLLLDSGRVFMLLGAIILMHQLTTSACAAAAAAASSDAEQVFIAFLLLLLGTALATLSAVAPQFPRLAVAVAAVATALRSYLLGGL